MWIFILTFFLLNLLFLLLASVISLLIQCSVELAPVPFSQYLGSLRFISLLLLNVIWFFPLALNSNPSQLLTKKSRLSHSWCPLTLDDNRSLKYTAFYVTFKIWFSLSLLKDRFMHLFSLVLGRRSRIFFFFWNKTKQDKTKQSKAKKKQNKQTQT